LISGLGFGVWGLGFSVVFGFRFRFREGADIGQNIEWRRLGLAHRPAAKRGHATQEAFARLAGQQVRRIDQPLTSRRHATVTTPISLSPP
jgi:hypothetical protein